MNDMKEKAMGAVKAFLERKGYEIVDEAWQGPEGIGGIDLWIGYTKLDSFVRAGRVRRSPWRTQSTPGISPTSSSGR